MFRSLIFAACLARISVAAPQPSMDNSPHVTNINWAKVNMVKCDDALMKEKFKQGIEEALTLAKTAALFDTDYTKDVAVQELFGKSLSPERIQRIKLVQFLASTWQVEGTVGLPGKGPGIAVEVHCDDYRKGNSDQLSSCADNQSGQKIAGYADNVYAKVEGKDTLVGTKFTICSDTLHEAKLLKEIEDDLAKTPARKNDLRYMKNLGYYILHELHHLDSIGTTPHIEDVTYGPARCKGIAKDTNLWGPEYTSKNADTYAWFAVAKYFEKKFKAYPNLPVYEKVPPTLVAQKESLDYQLPLQVEL